MDTDLYLTTWPAWGKIEQIHYVTTGPKRKVKAQIPASQLPTTHATMHCCPLTTDPCAYLVLLAMLLILLAALPLVILIVL